MVTFFTPLAYYFCLALPAVFTQPGEPSPVCCARSSPYFRRFPRNGIAARARLSGCQTSLSKCIARRVHTQNRRKEGGSLCLPHPRMVGGWVAEAKHEHCEFRLRECQFPFGGKEPLKQLAWAMLQAHSCTRSGSYPVQCYSFGPGWFSP